jgi:hypothetical protein
VRVTSGGRAVAVRVHTPDLAEFDTVTGARYDIAPGR